MGLVPYRIIAASAYLGAMALTVKSLSSDLADKLIAGTILPTAVAITAALKSVHSAGATHFTAKTAAEFVLEVRNAIGDAGESKIQHAQTQLMTQIHHKLAQSLSPADRTRARVLSASHEHASHWITKLPTEQNFKLNGNDLSFAIRHRIGLAPTDQNAQCVCGVKITNANHDHYHVCRKLTACTIPRHSTLQHAAKYVAQTAGSQVFCEYRTSLADVTKKRKRIDLRPDAAIIGVDHKFLIDISVTTPTAKSILKHDRKPTLTPLFAATRREKTKRDKYKQVTIDEAATFYGVVLESYGAIGKETGLLIAALNEHHKTYVPDSNWGLSNWAFRVLSFALQRGNAQLCYAAFRFDRRDRVSAARV